MIRIGGHYYTRGMQRIHPDGALEFACALEPGLVVALGKPGDMIARLDELLRGMRLRSGSPSSSSAWIARRARPTWSARV